MNARPPRPGQVERAKPCGFPYHCPLFDEHRFFIEVEEGLLGESRLSHDRWLALVGRVWCKGHAARGITPDLVACRQTLAETVQRDSPVARVAAQLRLALASREESPDLAEALFR